MKIQAPRTLSLGLFLGAALSWLPMAFVGPQQITAQRVAVLTAQDREILDHLSIEYLPDGQGGTAKTAGTGSYGSVMGGYQNNSSGTYSTVSGGYQRSVTGSYDWRAGNLIEGQ